MVDDADDNRATGSASHLEHFASGLFDTPLGQGTLGCLAKETCRRELGFAQGSVRRALSPALRTDASFSQDVRGRGPMCRMTPDMAVTRSGI